MKIVFMGTPDFARDSLEAIYNAGHDILAVVTNVDKPKGRGMKMIATPVKEFAIEKKLPVFQPEKVKKNVDKNQKDYLLREQQKVIREELGEDDIVSEADEYLEKCEALKASKEVKDKIKKEIKRYKKMPPVAAESTMTKNYIETMLRKRGYVSYLRSLSFYLFWLFC